MARLCALEDIDRLTKQLISSLTGFQVIWVANASLYRSIRF